MLNSVPVFAIEGPHRSGKSAVALATVSRLAELDYLPALVEDEGRQSPFIEDRLRGARPDTFITELHLLASRMRAEALATRHSGCVVCDRSVLSCLTYAIMSDPDGSEADPFVAMSSFALKYARFTYDVILLLDREFPAGVRVEDPFQPTTIDSQALYRSTIDRILSESGCEVVRLSEIEPSTETAERLTSHVIGTRRLLP